MHVILYTLLDLPDSIGESVQQIHGLNLLQEIIYWFEDERYREFAYQSQTSLKKCWQRCGGKINGNMMKHKYSKNSLHSVAFHFLDDSRYFLWYSKVIYFLRFSNNGSIIIEKFVTVSFYMANIFRTIPRSTACI